MNSQQDRTILCDLLPLKSCGLPRARPALPARGGARAGDLRAGAARGAARLGRGRVRRQLRDRPLAREPAELPRAAGAPARAAARPGHDPDGLAVQQARPAGRAGGRGARPRAERPALPVISARSPRAARASSRPSPRSSSSRSRTCRGATRRSRCPRGRRSRTGRSRRSSSMFGAVRLAEGESEEELVTVDLPEDALFSERGLGPPPARLSMPEELRARRPPDARSSEVLAESYAQASTELGVRVNDLREERDLARSRLAELQIALELAEQKAGEGEIEDRAQRILTILMRSAERRERQPAADHHRPAADPGAASARHRPARAHALGRPAPARAAGPGGGAARGGPAMPALGEALAESEPRLRVGGARAAALGRARAGARDPLLPAAHGAAPRRTCSTTSASWAASSPARSRRRRRARPRPAPTGCARCRAPRPRRSPRC